jgi:hypothetical protein
MFLTQIQLRVQRGSVVRGGIEGQLKWLRTLRKVKQLSLPRLAPFEGDWQMPFSSASFEMVIRVAGAAMSAENSENKGSLYAAGSQKIGNLTRGSHPNLRTGTLS